MLKNGNGQVLHHSVKNIVNTSSSIYILTLDGKVFLINYQKSSHEFVELKSTEFFTQISAGEHFLLLLNDEGSLYGYKEKDSGSMVFSLEEIELEKILPLKKIQSYLPNNTKIKMIKAGYETSFVIMEDKRVYSFDQNNYFEQGRKTATPSVPGIVKGDFDVDFLNKDEILKMCNAYATTIYLTTSGKAFGNGYKVHGELATNEDVIDDTEEPTFISFFKDKKLVDIACGVFHSLWLLDNGDVYGSGETDHKQLGQELRGWVRIPQKILSDVRWIFSTNNQSIFCTKDKVISYGEVNKEYRIDNSMDFVDARISKFDETSYFLYKIRNLNFQKIFEKRIFDIHFRFK